VEPIKQWTEFQAVMAAGTVARTAHFALHQSLKPTGPGFVQTQALFAVQRLGALTPKRWAKRAVTRNLIRRQIRAVAQSFAPHLPKGDYVVRVRAGFHPAHFVSADSAPLRQTVRQELMDLFNQISPCKRC